MSYKYRVTLSGIKGFFRLYALDSRNTLYQFHKQLRFDLEFPVDQPILFKALDAEGNVLARYALMDIGSGSVDNISIADTVRAGVASFVYFYDVKAKKSVVITLEGEDGECVKTPALLESKGPLPIDFENGYVAYEDLPPEQRHLPGKSADGDEEDENEDGENEDKEDEDKEDEEIIYDENEDA